MNPQTQPFDGLTFQFELDFERLNTQLARVRELMADGRWRTLEDIEAVTGYPQASISARLRDLRKAKNGSFTVSRRRRSEGQFEYQMPARWGS